MSRVGVIMSILTHENLLRMSLYGKIVFYSMKFVLCILKTKIAIKKII